MALTRNEIRKRLSAFSKEQQGKTNECSQVQTFWLRFYECFGIRAESATIYEQSVKKISGAQGFIDSFIPGKLIVEHKSKGKDLDAAFDQASEYFLSLKEEDRPRYIITSDFKDDAPRVAFLFERYQALHSLLAVTSIKKSRQKG